MARNLRSGLRRSLKPTIAGGFAANDLFTTASLDLNFAKQKNVGDLVTFTRASSGTYVDSEGVIQIASTDEPRFDHDPTTGESLGLLVEEQRTNSFEWSNSATQDETWNNVGTRLNLASGQSDPAGGTAGIRATDADNDNASTFLQRTSLANLTASTTVTYSVWLKPIDCPNNLITLNVFANATTDAINATFSVSGTAITEVSAFANGTGAASGASFEVFPNGWYLCRLTGVPSTVTMADVRARISLGGYQRAAGAARFDWYGAQLESGAFATSYIPTSGTAATRAADVASISGSNFSSWYRQDEGTTFAAYSQYASGGNIYTISDGTAANFITMQTNSIVNKAASANVFVASSNIGRIDSANAFTANLLAKAAYGLSNGSRSLVALGETAVTAANPATMPVVNRLFLGSNNNGTTTFANGHIRRLTYWPARLPDSTLQTITQ
jgi:hypothetical protein